VIHNARSIYRANLLASFRRSIQATRPKLFAFCRALSPEPFIRSLDSYVLCPISYVLHPDFPCSPNS
jgi:hypothetical protein